MPNDKVKEFLERVAEDPALKIKLEQSPTVEAFVAAAKALGFDITAEDVTRARSAGNLPMALSDADLDAVVGATGNCHQTKSDLPFPMAPETKRASCLINTQTVHGCPAPQTPAPTDPNPTPTAPAPQNPTPAPSDGGTKKFF